MIKTTTATFGTSEFRRHPGESLDPGDRRIADVLCYFLEDYAPGHAVHVRRDGPEFAVRFGDWSGNVVEPSSAEGLVSSGVVSRLLQMHRALKLVEAYYFLSKSSQLVDLQVSDYKFASPGFIAELFSRVIDVPRATTVEKLTPEVLTRSIADGCRVIKPAVYRNYEASAGVYLPMYARVR